MTRAPERSENLLLPSSGGQLVDGPWEQAFYAVLPGAVQSKANYRRGARTGTWNTHRGYEAAVRAAVRTARPAAWDKGDATTGVANRPKVVSTLVARALLDSGNLNKSILDACQGDLFVTDAQVISVSDTVIRAAKDQGLLAAFALLPAHATAAGVLQAQAALIAAVAHVLAPPS